MIKILCNKLCGWRFMQEIFVNESLYYIFVLPLIASDKEETRSDGDGRYHNGIVLQGRREEKYLLLLDGDPLGNIAMEIIPPDVSLQSLHSCEAKLADKLISKTFLETTGSGSHYVPPDCRRWSVLLVEREEWRDHRQPPTATSCFYQPAGLWCLQLHW